MQSSHDRAKACDCRSVLYMPASKLNVLNKGPTLDTDAIVLDLEDSVAPSEKKLARDNAIKVLQEFDYGYRLRAIRVNAEDTPWFEQDVLAAIEARADAVVLPKVETVENVLQISDIIEKNSTNDSLKLWVMMESPMAVLNAQSIAASSKRCQRLEAMLLGNNDMARAANMQVSKDRQFLVPWIMQLIAVAHAYSLTIWDGVYNDFSDLEGFKLECDEAVKMGMHGKTLIHPSQLGVCNDRFLPRDSEIAHAKKIVEAFEKPENAHLGAIQIEGQMVERLHLSMAEQLLKRVKRLSKRGG